MMHLLSVQPGSMDSGQAVNLNQTPGDIVILSAADSDLRCLAAAQSKRLAEDANSPSLRLANLLHLSHHYSVDLYVDTVIESAKFVLVRLLGGVAYWPYGVERLVEARKSRKILMAFLPGDDQPDSTLTRHSSLPSDILHRLWQYGVQGGVDNAVQCLRYVAALIGHVSSPGTESPEKGILRQKKPVSSLADSSLIWREPAPLPRAGFYLPGSTQHPCSLDDVIQSWKDPQAKDPQAKDQRARAALIFYRALIQSADTRTIDELVKALQQVGIDSLPMYVTSLKDPMAAAFVRQTLNQHRPDVILNAVAFAVGQPGKEEETLTNRQNPPLPYGDTDCPILQVVLAGSDRQSWQKNPQGLSARDIAMHVALPEIDGRLHSRAVAFKKRHHHDTATQCDIAGYCPLPDRIDFVAALAAAWTRLRNTPASRRRIALILANYPNRDGRLGNGVGLDAPAASVDILNTLRENGYIIEDIPADGEALIARLKAGPTNDYRRLKDRQIGPLLSLVAYQKYFSRLPASIQKTVTTRWGEPARDPFYLPDRKGFALAAFPLGNAIIGLQPARGYNIDPQNSYHDPALPPPHSYFAFYFWLRHERNIHAVIHVGKHGNLEWLPGKALALSQSCFPEAVLGALPHLYPFIVNDPGEGSQAKRRAAAAVIDHLTPPLTRAESHGAQAELEALADEYFEATTTDPRRLKPLRDQIRDLLARTGLDIDCGITRDESTQSALGKLDTYLCELKEMQIRDGLHIFGSSPQGDLADSLLLAIARNPRGQGENANQSLTRALSHDLGLGDFDPLDCDLGADWEGPCPSVLRQIDKMFPEFDPEGGTNQTPPSWRLVGDTVERLEILALSLIAGKKKPDSDWQETRLVLDWIETRLRPLLNACGDAEMQSLLAGLEGKFIQPGPSGAPTRGRPDVLPTGRNFYALDTRSVPTMAAWELGWKSASRLAERYAREQGDWPRRLAITAWGTSNMRTGGDDIAQALALIGAKPRWDDSSRRVSGFEILPRGVLGRPRIDVVLRISGFFRDAFPNLIDLFDSAITAIAALDEPASINPVAAAYREDMTRLKADGLDDAKAHCQASARVFGSRPGAYGAGLQALIDERGWHDKGDLARAYLAWGGYAYGKNRHGMAAHTLFARHLKDVEAVIHNQDNREHDLLDSDDYYQFEGGLSASIEHLSGREPTQYHSDHSRPFSPRIYSLSEEIARVVRARATNPKWLRGVMRHGYKGAFEMAATVDYLFAFAATTSCVQDHHFDALYQAYLLDDKVRDFLQTTNPDALGEISARLKEAIDRRLWQPRANSTYATLEALATPEP